MSLEHADREHKIANALAAEHLSYAQPIRFCQHCGSQVEQRIPAGDSRLRAICRGCGFIHYINPRVVVCALPIHADGRVLLCQRNIEPRKHKWTAPGGFLELDEAVEEGALRETHEETHCRIRLIRAFSMISVTKVGQVHCFFTAALIHEDLSPTDESEAVRLFAPEEIPWEDLAFRTIKTSLSLLMPTLVQCRQRGIHGEELYNGLAALDFHCGQIVDNLWQSVAGQTINLEKSD